MIRLVTAFAVSLLLASQAVLAQTFSPPVPETPVPLEASRILPQALLKGPHHRVEERVENDGLMNTYTVRSRYGTFRVVSTALLAARVDEFKAMALMDRASGAEEYGKGVWEGGVSVVRGVKNIVTEPVRTFESAASGVGRLFARAGDDSKASKYEDSTGAKLTGFASSRREYAVAFGVDPYSTNDVLQERLRSLAAAGYAGSVTSMGLKALIPGGVGIAVTSVGGVNWLNEVDLSQPPAELRLANKEALQAMGARQEAIAAFMDNQEFTPTQQSLLVKALGTMRGVGSKSLFLTLAAGTENQDQALFRQRMAQMYSGYHLRVNSLRGFTQLGSLVGAASSRGRLVLCFPLDHLCWTERVAGLVREAEAAMERHKSTGAELWVTGTVSPLARKILEGRRWKVFERAGKELLKESI